MLFHSIPSAGGNQCLLNEKEKDRQEENACSAFNRVSPRLSGPKETSRPTCRGLGCAGGVVSTPGAGRRGRLGRDTGLTALCQACGGRWPLRGRLYLEIPERAERGTRGVSWRSPLCWGRIWERRGLPAESTPRVGHAAWPRRARRTGMRVHPAGRTPPAQDPARCGIPHQTPVRATRVGQGLLPVLP